MDRKHDKVEAHEASGRFWSRFPTWQEADQAWDKQAQAAVAHHPIKKLNHRPKMQAMTPDTRKGFRYKALKYLVSHDVGFKLVRSLLKHPFRYGWNYLLSLIRGTSYRREGDFFWYGLLDEKTWVERINSSPEASLLIGFSYCHKPFECPDGRFSDQCRADETSPICQQCFIGKMVHAAPKRAELLFIPTVHYIAQKVFEAKERSSTKEVIFLITACEMTLEMFGDWGNAIGLEGIGVRLEGRICNTMDAFDLSERGIKPGLTLVDEPTQERMLHLLKELSMKGAS